MPAVRRAMTLPEIVDCRARYREMPLAEVRFGELLWESVRAWRFEYQAVYGDGTVDSRLYGRAMAGESELDARIAWRRLEAGFGVIKLLLYHVRRPLTNAEIVELNRLNRGLILDRTNRTDGTLR